MLELNKARTRGEILSRLSPSCMAMMTNADQFRRDVENAFSVVSSCVHSLRIVQVAKATRALGQQTSRLFSLRPLWLCHAWPRFQWEMWGTPTLWRTRKLWRSFWRRPWMLRRVWWQHGIWMGGMAFCRARIKKWGFAQATPYSNYNQCNMCFGKGGASGGGGGGGRRSTWRLPEISLSIHFGIVINSNDW